MFFCGKNDAALLTEVFPHFHDLLIVVFSTDRYPASTSKLFFNSTHNSVITGICG